MSCYLWCKDTNFNANHNKLFMDSSNGLVVIYGAKILILMQITTEIVNKWQDTCCYLWCKDTNFNANHNSPLSWENALFVVIYGAKILILMQITTGVSGLKKSFRLLFMVQRY